MLVFLLLDGTALKQGGVGAQNRSLECIATQYKQQCRANNLISMSLCSRGDITVNIYIFSTLREMQGPVCHMQGKEASSRGALCFKKHQTKPQQLRLMYVLCDICMGERRRGSFIF